MSWGPGLTALLGAGALFWTIGNSVRRDTKAEVAALADSTDRKIAALADAIAAMGKVHDREMANIREAQAKNTANIANLEKSIDKLEIKLEKHAAENAKGFAELRESQDKGMAALRESQDKGFAELRESQDKGFADCANPSTRAMPSCANLRPTTPPRPPRASPNCANPSTRAMPSCANLRPTTPPRPPRASPNCANLRPKPKSFLREFIAKTDASITRIDASIARIEAAVTKH